MSWDGGAAKPNDDGDDERSLTPLPKAAFGSTMTSRERRARRGGKQYTQLDNEDLGAWRGTEHSPFSLSKRALPSLAHIISSHPRFRLVRSDPNTPPHPAPPHPTPQKTCLLLKNASLKWAERATGARVLTTVLSRVQRRAIGRGRARGSMAWRVASRAGAKPASSRGRTSKRAWASTTLCSST